MEGDLGKKSIHTSDSFLHSHYFGIMVNGYSISFAYMTICTFVTYERTDSDLTNAKYQTLNGQCVIDKLCMHTVACKLLSSICWVYVS